MFLSLQEQRPNNGERAHRVRTVVSTGLAVAPVPEGTDQSARIDRPCLGTSRLTAKDDQVAMAGIRGSRGIAWRPTDGHLTSFPRMAVATGQREAPPLVPATVIH